MATKKVTSNVQKTNNANENNVLDDTPRKKTNKRNSSSAEQTLSASKKEVSDILRNNMKWMNFGAKSRANTDEEVEERLREFFEGMCETGELPTVEKMALALGVTRKTLWEWEHNQSRPERARMIQQGKELLAAMDAELVNRSKIPVVSYIFRAKNYFHMKDTQEIEVSSPQNLLGEEANREEIAARYSEVVAEIPTDIIDTE